MLYLVYITLYRITVTTVNKCLLVGLRIKRECRPSESFIYIVC